MSTSTKSPKLGSKSIQVVAITGANGFIASHIVKELLQRGYQVRACVRNKDDTEKTAHLQALMTTIRNLPKSASLTFYSADLFQEGSYDQAFQGADAVIHSAAIVEIHRVPDPMKQIVNPSVKGTENVLRSIDKSPSVKRFVHTSSVAAILNADKVYGTKFTEEDWNTYSTIANGDPYGYAKAMAERLVWDHCSGKHYDVVVINPGVSLGPCMTKAHTKGSAVVLRQMVFGNEQPNYFAAFVDVRDVAKAHVNALEVAEAAGKRVLCTNRDATMWVMELGPMAQQLFPEYRIQGVPIASYKIWVAYLLSFIPYFGSSMLSPFATHLITKTFYYDSTRSQQLLKVIYTPLLETIKDTIVSMVEPGWVKPKARK
jgi:nucleoside-diphosphate-sugar epimerase